MSPDTSAYARFPGWLGRTISQCRSRAHGSFPSSGALHHVHHHPGPLSADAPAAKAHVGAEGAAIHD